MVSRFQPTGICWFPPPGDQRLRFYQGVCLHTRDSQYVLSWFLGYRLVRSLPWKSLTKLGQNIGKPFFFWNVAWNVKNVFLFSWVSPLLCRSCTSSHTIPRTQFSGGFWGGGGTPWGREHQSKTLCNYLMHNLRLLNTTGFENIQIKQVLTQNIRKVEFIFVRL